ncbi:(2Fe-2S)-binding protein [Muriicola sp.]|uniref:(2Fe-2S)-binding protein n=1 Tax=Muriicola sp. TaxID=2020856 RepID=UPI003C77DE95
MKSYSLKINGQTHEVEADEGALLLWVLREHLGLTGTKYGCGIAQCGACTVHMGGQPVRACTIPLSGIDQNQEITTIEGLSEDGTHPVQMAWIEAQAPQCGYCQSGQIMQAVALLEQNSSPSREEIKSYMNGNLCRCGTYMRIVKAIEIASNKQMNS